MGTGMWSLCLFFLITIYIYIYIYIYNYVYIYIYIYIKSVFRFFRSTVLDT